MSELKCMEPSIGLPDWSVMLKMEGCAEFLARMVEKYGKEVLEEMESGESEEKKIRNNDGCCRLCLR
ncbi:hypothetical protein D3Z58_19330 [Clostridiaceae bacterium]|mgnify:CR=1 FL=1|nr:hypothetical protein [Clostridiaceae bacterium]